MVRAGAGMTQPRCSGQVNKGVRETVLPWEVTCLVVPLRGTFPLPIILWVINDDSHRCSVPGEDQSMCLLQISVNYLTSSATNLLSLYRALLTGNGSSLYLFDTIDLQTPRELAR